MSTITYNFLGKVALVTGSSSGIGAATAQLFAKSGANVVVTGRNADGLAKVAKQCTDVSPKQLTALEVVGDLTNKEDCDRLIETTVQKFGKLDILVNNAGLSSMAKITDDDYMEKYMHVMSANLNSVVYMTHKCVPYLAKTRGNVINISSIAGMIPFRQSMSAYCMSKAAVDMFTKCMAAELGPKHHIRVNSVNPGMTHTSIVQRMAGLSKEKDDVYWQQYTKLYPIGRCGSPEDIANAVCYLANDAAAGFITGTCLLADGGHIAANVNLDSKK
ncbi:uncharacterized oxidoreductase SSP0419-like [Oppia nitens]|uniref:uncharacterized oxidoreductase SSP0419-like n=1 Tax=Oppia nitens TaxID=1686743 RepID=UPI0023D9C874|nr:uncharacterized oxidoreductase SSP0419-like [Oppia nitens]